MNFIDNVYNAYDKLDMQLATLDPELYNKLYEWAATRKGINDPHDAVDIFVEKVVEAYGAYSKGSDFNWEELATILFACLVMEAEDE